jgi:hypothetical protein
MTFCRRIKINIEFWLKAEAFCRCLRCVGRQSVLVLCSIPGSVPRLRHGGVIIAGLLIWAVLLVQIGFAFFAGITEDNLFVCCLYLSTLWKIYSKAVSSFNSQFQISFLLKTSVVLRFWKYLCKHRTYLSYLGFCSVIYSFCKVQLILVGASLYLFQMTSPG